MQDDPDPIQKEIDKFTAKLEAAAEKHKAAGVGKTEPPKKNPVKESLPPDLFKSSKDVPHGIAEFAAAKGYVVGAFKWKGPIVKGPDELGTWGLPVEHIKELVCVGLTKGPLVVYLMDKEAWSDLGLSYYQIEDKGAAEAIADYYLKKPKAETANLAAEVLQKAHQKATEKAAKPKEQKVVFQYTPGMVKELQDVVSAWWGVSNHGLPTPSHILLIPEADGFYANLFTSWEQFKKFFGWDITVSDVPAKKVSPGGASVQHLNVNLNLMADQGFVQLANTVIQALQDLAFLQSQTKAPKQ